MRKFVAVYIDLENVAGILDLDKMLQDIILEDQKEETEEHVFAVKFACGDSRSITRLRSSLVNHNFDIREAPHVSGKKNRADLIISLDAFEKLFLDKPAIDRFVFVTSDSDFSVIMDLLRKYGKEVWLITKEGDEERPIFTNCSDNIIVIPKKEKKIIKPNKVAAKPDIPQKKSQAVEKPVKTDDIRSKDEIADELFLRVLASLDPSEEHMVNSISNKMRQLNKSFKIRRTSYKKMSTLVKKFESKGMLKTRKSAEGPLLVHELETHS